MNKALRCAWFNLGITLFLALLHGAAFTFIFKIGHVPRVLNTIGFVVVVGALVGAKIIFERKEKLAKIDFDERDNFINKRVLAMDYGLLWSLLIAGCVGSWFLMGPEGDVKVYVLCFLLYVSFLITAIAHSAATIVMYGKGTATGSAMEACHE